MKKVFFVALLAAVSFSAKAQLDWQDVEVANFESEVTDLAKLDMVTSKAKGMTVYSSQGKMQTRAINKMKMFTAMLGGNTVLILNQQSQSAQHGWATSTSAGANISGLAYTDKVVEVDDIEEGIYLTQSMYYMGPNHQKIQIQETDTKYQLTIEKDKMVQKKDGVQLRVTYNFSAKYTPREWTVSKVEGDMIYLSGIHDTGKGKMTYLTVTFRKIK